ncbi:MAG: UDP-2,3-diacylglucosamine diphosphatase [Verrucomicrobiales bacterium]|nr:UDP-2,3-diacylglucosamine diphosphatase [Verrucomicrobiales bacterium]
MNYRTIWISDVHLGSRHAQTELLLDFLRENECRHLYLVGDIVDGWELKRRWLWNSESNTVVQKLLRKQRNNTRVTYIHGNHDEFLQQFAGLSVGGVRIAEHAIHIGPDRKRYLVIHGHQLDGLVHFNRLLERVGSRLYDVILELNTHFNRLRRRLGFGYWSVSAYLKHNTKSAVRYITQFEDAMIQLARKHRVHGVICGHIHRAEQRNVRGIRYLNCGDWVESCTALAEDYDGVIHILHWHEHVAKRAAAGRDGPKVTGPEPPTPSEQVPSRHRPVEEFQPDLAGLL